MRPEERAAWRTLAAATPEVRAQAFEEAKEDGWVTNGATSAFVGADSVGASGSDGSTGASPVSEGHGTDPRPVSDLDSEVSDAAAGSPSRGTPETSEPSARPGARGGPEGRRDDHAGAGDTSAPPPQPQRTNLRPPPEPRDPSSGI